MTARPNLGNVDSASALSALHSRTSNSRSRFATSKIRRTFGGAVCAQKCEAVSASEPGKRKAQMQIQILTDFTGKSDLGKQLSRVIADAVDLFCTEHPRKRYERS
jgi:hypothetical protein